MQKKVYYKKLQVTKLTGFYGVSPIILLDSYRVSLQVVLFLNGNVILVLRFGSSSSESLIINHLEFFIDGKI